MNTNPSVNKEIVSAQWSQKQNKITNCYNQFESKNCAVLPTVEKKKVEAIIKFKKKPTKTGTGGINTGHWSAEDHDKFVKAYNEYGRNWKLISSLVGTRTGIQVRTHAQKYFKK